MEKGRKYKLLTFNGTNVPEDECDKSENYWELIGVTGTIKSFADELNFHNKNRVLFQFDCNIKEKGLECHNEETNALWILATDLV